MVVAVNQKNQLNKMNKLWIVMNMTVSAIDYVKLKEYSFSSDIPHYFFP